jgi:hypothetical protein
LSFLTCSQAPKPGQKQRVGNARDLDLAGRVQLAVNAHIRHLYTNYDQLLKNGVPWVTARATIGPTCVAILRNWMDEDNMPELEETFQEWIDLRDDEEDDDSSSMEGISDSEARRRNSLNAIHPVHEAPPGLPGPAHSRAPVHDSREDLRMVSYRPDPEYVLPSIESPTRLEHSSHRPFSYHAPQHVSQHILHDAPPPPAPSPPTYRAPPGAAYDRRPAVVPNIRRVDSDHSAYQQEPARIAPRDHRANVIDLTDSPNIPRTFREAEYAPRYSGAPNMPVYALPQQGILPRAVAVGPIRGGEGSPHAKYHDHEMQDPDSPVRLVNARQASRINNGRQTARPAVNGTRPVAHDPFPHLDYEAHPLMARNNRNNNTVSVTASRLPPPPNKEPPHPAVPRTGWVVFPAMNRQGEAVR